MRGRVTRHPSCHYDQRSSSVFLRSTFRVDCTESRGESAKLDTVEAETVEQAGQRLPGILCSGVEHAILHGRVANLALAFLPHFGFQIWIGAGEQPGFARIDFALLVVDANGENLSLRQMHGN